jgi:hypothetical protein
MLIVSFDSQYCDEVLEGELLLDEAFQISAGINQELGWVFDFLKPTNLGDLKKNPKSKNSWV